MQWWRIQCTGTICATALTHADGWAVLLTIVSGPSVHILNTVRKQMMFYIIMTICLPRRLSERILGYSRSLDHTLSSELTPTKDVFSGWVFYYDIVWNFQRMVIMCRLTFSQFNYCFYILHRQYTILLSVARANFSTALPMVYHWMFFIYRHIYVFYICLYGRYIYIFKELSSLLHVFIAHIFSQSVFCLFLPLMVSFFF